MRAVQVLTSYRKAVHAVKYVPEEIMADYIEAMEVLPISPNASAALARRCLQTLIRHCLSIKKERLSDDIKKLLESKELPAHLHEGVGKIRMAGNRGAHGERDLHTGLIVNVEPGEAEWMLEMLNELFQHFFVIPKRYETQAEKFKQKFPDTKAPKSPV